VVTPPTVARPVVVHRGGGTSPVAVALAFLAGVLAGGGAVFLGLRVRERPVPAGPDPDAGPDDGPDPDAGPDDGDGTEVVPDGTSDPGPAPAQTRP
jgi:hypothetical protein